MLAVCAVEGRFLLGSAEGNVDAVQVDGFAGWSGGFLLGSACMGEG